MTSARFFLPLLCAMTAAMAAAAGSLTPPAGTPGPTMITLFDAEPRVAVTSLAGDESASHVISEPGSYMLTGNLVGEAGKAGIRIDADNVTLDLDGFAMLGPAEKSTVAGASAIVTNGERRSVTIRNGTITGWGKHAIEGMSCTACAALDLFARENGGEGAYAAIFLGAYSRVSRCVARDTYPWTGIQVLDASLVTGCVSMGNANGYELSGDSHLAIRLQAVGNGAHGIYAQGSGIIAESVAQSNDFGFSTGDSTVIVDGASSWNNVGVRVGGSNALVLRHHARAELGSGFVVAPETGGTVLRDNHADACPAAYNTEGSGVNLLVSNDSSGSAEPFRGTSSHGVVFDWTAGGGAAIDGSPWANIVY